MKDKTKRAISLFLAAVFTLSWGTYSRAAYIMTLEDIEYDTVGETVSLMENIELSDSDSYSNGYILVEPATTIEAGQLSVSEDGTISTEDGVVSIVNGVIYIGDNGSASSVGSVHSTLDGKNGEALRIDFSTPLTNGDFEEGGDGIVGWTVNESEVTLGDLAIRTKEGMYDSQVNNGNGTYTVTGPSGAYTYTTDRDYYNSFNTGNKYEGIETASDGSITYSSSLIDETGYGKVLKLTSSGSIDPPSSSDAYGSNFGPEVISDVFQAKAGDSLSLDWKAADGGDDYEIYGYLEKLNDENQTEITSRELLMYGRGGIQNWTAATAVIAEDGTYQFHFISGTYDRSGGRAVGATLYVDNVKIFSSSVEKSVAEEVARRVTYTLTEHVSPQTIEMAVTLSDKNGEKQNAEVNVIVKASTDATLSDLSLAEAEFDVAFSSDKLTYSATVGYETTSVEVTATTTNSYATLSINGNAVQSETTTNAALAIGTNEIPITVTAEDGLTELTYTVNVIREDDREAPVISGVEEGVYYNTPRTVTVSDDTTTTVTLDGQEFISGNSVSEEGEHTVIAVDAAGNTSEIVFYVDMTSPEISLEATTEQWTSGLEIAAEFYDALGLGQVRLPGGSWTAVAEATTAASLTVSINSNGSYTFSAMDNAGNQRDETLVISNVDAGIPAIDYDLSTTDWTNEDIAISVNVNPSESGLAQLTMPDASSTTSTAAIYMVSENGDYTFSALNNAGNSATKTVSVTTIDKVDPYISYSISTEDWTNDAVIIELNGEDALSGVAGWVLADETESEEPTVSYSVYENGIYTFVLKDHAGNKAEISIEINNIDKTAPTSPEVFGEGNYISEIVAGTDQESGVSNVVYSLTGTTEQEESVFSEPFRIRTYGITTVTAYTVDRAGNRSEATTFQVTILQENKNEDKSNQDSPYVTVDGNKDINVTQQTTYDEGKVVITNTLDGTKLSDRLEGEEDGVIIKVSFDSSTDKAVTNLNGQLVKNMENRSAVLEITRGNVTYAIPALQMNISKVSDELGNPVKLEDIDISVSLEPVSSVEAELLEGRMTELGYQMLTNPVSFTITGSYKGKDIEVNSFNSFVERSFTIDNEEDAQRITTGVAVGSGGNLTHVPTRVEEVNGKYIVHIMSLHNSTYSVIYNSKTFDDTKGHWSEETVANMASRLIVNGVTESSFAPEQAMTRAEFAATMVRALGLDNDNTHEADFRDVKTSDWYYNAIAIAAEYGLINGTGDGFYPDRTITRQEAMSMIARVYEHILSDTEMSDSEAIALEDVWNDSEFVDDWAKEAVELCTEKQIIIGDDTKMLNPLENVTRAESTVMIYRMLKNSELID